MQPIAKNIPELSESDKTRFFSKINKDGPLPDQSNPHYAGLGPCWIWTEYKFRGGYGVFWAKSRNISAHRISYVISNGEPPVESRHVLHKCDNRLCVNPSHLSIGTNHDNSLDRMSKDRGTRASGDKNGSRLHPERLRRGENHPAKLNPENLARGERVNTAKLTESKVIEIRSAYATGDISQRTLSVMFGVDQTMISLIVRRKSWTHVP
jgi:hypothetical protein